MTFPTAGPLLVVTLLSATTFADERQVVVSPQETDEILANPGMAGRRSIGPAKRTRTYLPGFHRPSSMPVGAGGTGTPARQDRLRLPGQGAQGVARVRAEVGVPGDVLLVVASPAIPSPMATGYQREDRTTTVRERPELEVPGWMIPKFWPHISILSTAWGNVMMVIPISTTSIWARSDGGASGT